MKKLLAIVIDDEEDSIEGLKIALANENVELIASYTSAIKAIKEIPNMQFDLLFLDMKLENEKTTGIEVIENITAKNFFIIFLSAYPEYASDAWEFRDIVLDYLTKPIRPMKLTAIINKAELEISKKKNIIQSNKTSISIDNLKDRQKKEIVKLDDIICIEARNNHSRITTKDSKAHLKNMSLKDVEAQLTGTNFLRVHKSWIVNSDCIITINKSEKFLVMMNSVGDEYGKVDIGETYEKKVFSILDNMIF